MFENKKNLFFVFFGLIMLCLIFGLAVFFVFECINTKGHMDEESSPELLLNSGNIIIPILSAVSLDENYNFLADIYSQTKSKDDVWASVSYGNYARAVFVQPLEKSSDITIYARPHVSGDRAVVEVYPVYVDDNGDKIEGEKVAVFSNIDSQKTYKVLLTELRAPTDTFDLKIISGAGVEFDYIVDPTFNDTNNGNWNSGATWGNPGNDVEGSGYPGPSDNAVIDSNTVTLTAPQSVNNITISGGTLSAGAQTLSVYGDWSKTSGTFTASTSTINFKKTSDTQTLNSGGTSGNEDFYHLTHSGAGTLQLITNAILVSGNFSNSGGNFDAQSNGMTVTGTFTHSTGIFTAPSGTLTIFSTSNLTGGTFIHNNGTVTFMMHSNYSLTTAGATFYNLIINRTSGSSHYTLTLNDSFSVANDLTYSMNDTYNNNVVGASSVYPVITVSGDLLLPSTPGSNGGSYLGSSTAANNLTVNLAGDLTMSDTQNSLFANITFNGTSDQTITQTLGTINYGTWKGDKTSGSLILGTSVTIGSSGSFSVTANTCNFTNNGNGLILNGTFSQSGTSTFTAPTNLTIYSTFNLTGGTFIHNNGTVTFIMHSDYSLTTAGATFYNLTFNRTSGSWFYTLTLNDSFNVANDLTYSMNDTYNNNVVGASSVYPVITVSGDLLLPSTPGSNGGSYLGSSTAANNLTVNLAGDLTMSDTQNSLFANITFNGVGTQNITQTLGTINYGAWKVDSASSVATQTTNVTLGANNTSLVLTSGTWYTNGKNLTISTNTFTNTSNGTLMLQGGEVTLSFTKDTTNGTVEYVGDGGSTTYNSLIYGNTYHHLKINSTSGNNSFSPNDTLTVGGNLTISAGTLDATTSNYGINFAGNWSNSGTFTSHSGTVTLTGTNQSITGTNTFYNLTKTDAVNDETDKTLTFDNTSTQTISGLLTLTGTDSTDRVNLVSDSPGDQWELTANGTFSIDYVETTDSDASGGSTIVWTNTVDGGNNTNWAFDTTPPVQSAHDPADSSTIADTTQDITFTTDENATCYLSLDGDEAYTDMADDTLCTGGGTTSQSCTTPDLGADGAKTVYLACTDGTNANTADTNTALSYTLDTCGDGTCSGGETCSTCSADCGTCGGGGGSSSHYECGSQKCIFVSGDGADQCSSDPDCDIACTTGLDCGTNGYSGSLFCQNNNVYQNYLTYTCNSPGTIASSCTTLPDPQLKTTCSLQQLCIGGSCVDQNSKYNKCNGSQCVSVDGLGADQCSSNSDCVELKHNECNAQQQCVVVSGQRDDECQTSSECAGDSNGDNENDDENENGGGAGGGDEGNGLDDTKPGPLKIVESVTKSAEKYILDPVKTVSERTKKIVGSPQGSMVTKTISTVGAASGFVGVASVAVFAPTSIFEIFLIPLRLFGLLLTALGLKKRFLPWGTVYDSVTKQPLDPAYVVLKNVKTGESFSAITDLDGRYGFLVQPGVYQISVRKTNYRFPSKKLSNVIGDEIYPDLYFGQDIEIKKYGQAIVKNIPLDPIGFDWNEFTKKNKNLMKFYSRWDVVVRKISDFLFAIGLVVAIVAYFAAPYPYNTVIVGLYLFMLLLGVMGVRPKKFGSIIEKATGMPLSFAIIKVLMLGSDIEVAHRVADKYGRYYCLVPKEKYYVKIKKKNTDGSYSLVYTSPVIDVSKNGIIKERFTV